MTKCWCRALLSAHHRTPLLNLGATPVFIDSEEENWNIDPELLEVAIKDRIAKTGEYDSNFWLCTITLDPNLKIKGQDNAYNETP